MSKVKAVARVKITLDIPLGDSWGADCPIAQVQEQASRSVLAMLRNNKIAELARALIIGEPQVTAILIDEEKP